MAGRAAALSGMIHVSSMPANIMFAIGAVEQRIGYEKLASRFISFSKLYTHFTALMGQITSFYFSGYPQVLLLLSSLAPTLT